MKSPLTLFSFVFLVLLLSVSVVNSDLVIDIPDDLTVITNVFQGNLTNLSELSDVSIPSPSNDFVLTYVSANNRWESLSAQSSSDTNETTRFDGLVASDCASGNLVIGVLVNGTVNCVVDDVGLTWADAINGTLADNSSIAIYLLAQDVVANTTLKNWIDGQGFITSGLTWDNAVNGSLLLATGDTATGNYTFDTDTFFIDSSSNRIGIGTITPIHTLEVNGHIGINRSASVVNQHALEIVADANGFGDFTGLLINYMSGAIGDGDDAAITLINIDQSLSTGGDISGLQVLTVEGSSKIFGLKVGVLVDPIHQDSGTFGNMSSAAVKGVDRLTEFAHSASDIVMFVADNDNITIGNTEQFEEIEVILDTVASGAGIVPTFEFSTGVNTWTTFSPIDATNGFRTTGVLTWETEDIPTWVVGTDSEYKIRITRTQNGLGTTPIEDKIQIAAVTIYEWDELGNLSINNISANFYFGDGSGLTNLPTGITWANVVNGTLVENNTGGWKLNFSTLNSYDWANVTIISSQVSNFNLSLDVYNTSMKAYVDSLVGGITWADALNGTLVENNTGGWKLNFSTLNSFDWSNVTIISSQVSNFNLSLDSYNTSLKDYLDTKDISFNDSLIVWVDNKFVTNVSTNSTICDKVVGSYLNGSFICGVDATSAGITWANAINGTLLENNTGKGWEINFSKITVFDELLSYVWGNVTIISSQVSNFNFSLDTYNTSLKDYLDTKDTNFNDTMKVYVDSLVGGITWADALNGTLPQNSTLVSFNSTMKAYVDAKDTAFNNTIPDSQVVDALTISSSGSVDDGALSSNICLLDTVQDFTAEKTFTADVNITTNLNVSGTVFVQHTSTNITSNATCLFLYGTTSTVWIC